MVDHKKQQELRYIALPSSIESPRHYTYFPDRNLPLSFAPFVLYTAPSIYPSPMYTPSVHIYLTHSPYTIRGLYTKRQIGYREEPYSARLALYMSQITLSLVSTLGLSIVSLKHVPEHPRPLLMLPVNYATLCCASNRIRVDLLIR